MNETYVSISKKKKFCAVFIDRMMNLWWIVFCPGYTCYHVKKFGND